MHHTAPARSVAAGPSRLAIVGLAGVLIAIIGTLGDPSTSPAASSTSSVVEADPPGPPRAVPQSAASTAPSFSDALRVDHRPAAFLADGVVTQDDGALPDGVTVFDDLYPGIARLDPQLLDALRKAATQAGVDGIELDINSGWRSPEYQNQLLREAIAKYGSAVEAARWVASADTSAHVSGDAVDIGSVDAMTWLSMRGVRFGLCQIYRNEPWHFEWRPKAVGRGCPPMYADSAHDPRMQP